MMNQLQSPCLATNDKVALRVAEAVGGVTEPVGGVAYGVRGAASHMSFVGLPHEHEQRVSLQRLMGGWLYNLLKWDTSGSMTLIMRSMESRRE